MDSPRQLRATALRLETTIAIERTERCTCHQLSSRTRTCFALTSSFRINSEFRLFVDQEALFRFPSYRSAISTLKDMGSSAHSLGPSPLESLNASSASVSPLSLFDFPFFVLGAATSVGTGLGNEGSTTSTTRDGAEAGATSASGLNDAATLFFFFLGLSPVVLVFDPEAAAEAEPAATGFGAGVLDFDSAEGFGRAKMSSIEVTVSCAGALGLAFALPSLPDGLVLAFVVDFTMMSRC